MGNGSSLCEKFVDDYGSKIIFRICFYEKSSRHLEKFPTNHLLNIMLLAAEAASQSRCFSHSQKGEEEKDEAEEEDVLIPPPPPVVVAVGCRRDFVVDFFLQT